VKFQSKDGTELSGWFIFSDKKTKGTIIHFHGNAQNMSAHLPFAWWLPNYGFNLFTFDYRGYGNSKGYPSREGVYQDSIAALKYVLSRKDIDKTRIGAFGQSLGGANLLAMMKEPVAANIKAILIDSSFYSYREIVRDKIKLIPLIKYINKPFSYLLVTNQRSPEFSIPFPHSTPAMIIHGTKDRTIPYRHGIWIYKHLNEPKEMISIKNGYHLSAFSVKDHRFRQAAANFFLQYLQ